MFPRKPFVAAFALAGALGAQQVGGVFSGAVFDEQAKAVRLIAGVPGAAYLNGALARGEEGSVSPDGKLAIVRTGSDLNLVRLGDGSASRIGSAPAAIEIVAWSADSRSAAVEAGSIQLFINLDSSPEQVPLAAFDGDALGLAPGARSVAVAARGGVYRLNADTATLIAQADDPRGLGASNGTLYITDRARHEVSAVKGWETSPEFELIASQAQGLDAPVAVAVDGGSILIADAGSRFVHVINLATRAVSASVALEFEPSRLDVVTRNSYRLDTRKSAQDPVQILQLGPEPAVYFVPAAASLED